MSSKNAFLYQVIYIGRNTPRDTLEVNRHKLSDIKKVCRKTEMMALLADAADNFQGLVGSAGEVKMLEAKEKIKLQKEATSHNMTSLAYYTNLFIGMINQQDERRRQQLAARAEKDVGVPENPVPSEKGTESPNDARPEPSVHSER